VFVDSSAWFAVASASDGRHSDADHLLREAVRAGIPLLTTNLVLAEVHRLALMRMGIQPALAALDRIANSALVTLVYPSQEHHRTAREWLARLADQPISYTDAISFAVMASARCDVAMTFDRHFAVAGFRLWRIPRA
jgi:predicted nucleic acid-binding protein